MPIVREVFDSGENFRKKLMMWLGIYSKGVTSLVMFGKGMVNHARYIKEVLPVVVKYENRTFRNSWVFQQDGAKPHTHAKSQAWCEEHLPWFIGKYHWPPNSPGLNPLHYCILCR
jgi:hypothetical protein